MDYQVGIIARLNGWSGYWGKSAWTADYVIESADAIHVKGAGASESAQASSSLSLNFKATGESVARTDGWSGFWGSHDWKVEKNIVLSNAVLSAVADATGQAFPSDGLRAVITGRTAISENISPSDIQHAVYLTNANVTEPESLYSGQSANTVAVTSSTEGTASADSVYSRIQTSGHSVETIWPVYDLSSCIKATSDSISCRTPAESTGFASSNRVADVSCTGTALSSQSVTQSTKASISESAGPVDAQSSTAVRNGILIDSGDAVSDEHVILAAKSDASESSVSGDSGSACIDAVANALEDCTPIGMQLAVATIHAGTVEKTTASVGQSARFSAVASSHEPCATSTEETAVLGAVSSSIENVGTSDSVIANADYIAEASDTAYPSSNQQSVYRTLATTAETADLIDGASAVSDRIADCLEAVSCSDNAASNISVGVYCHENTGVTDSITVNVDYIAAVSDTAYASSHQRSVYKTLAVVAELAGLIDGETATADRFADCKDAAAPSENSISDIVVLVEQADGSHPADISSSVMLTNNVAMETVGAGDEYGAKLDAVASSLEHNESTCRAKANVKTSVASIETLGSDDFLSCNAIIVAANDEKAYLTGSQSSNSQYPVSSSERLPTGTLESAISNRFAGISEFSLLIENGHAVGVFGVRNTSQTEATDRGSAASGVYAGYTCQALMSDTYSAVKSAAAFSYEEARADSSSTPRSGRLAFSMESCHSDSQAYSVAFRMADATVSTVPGDTASSSANFPCEAEEHIKATRSQQSVTARMVAEQSEIILPDDLSESIGLFHSHNHETVVAGGNQYAARHISGTVFEAQSPDDFNIGGTDYGGNVFELLYPYDRTFFLDGHHPWRVSGDREARVDGNGRYWKTSESRMFYAGTDGDGESPGRTWAPNGSRKFTVCRDSRMP